MSATPEAGTTSSTGLPDRVSMSIGPQHSVSMLTGHKDGVSMSTGPQHGVSMSTGHNDSVSMSTGHNDGVSMSNTPEAGATSSTGLHDGVSMSTGPHDDISMSTVFKTDVSMSTGPEDGVPISTGSQRNATISSTSRNSITRSQNVTTRDEETTLIDTSGTIYEDNFPTDTTGPGVVMRPKDIPKSKLSERSMRAPVPSLASVDIAHHPESQRGATGGVRSPTINTSSKSERYRHLSGQRRVAVEIDENSLASNKSIKNNAPTCNLRSIPSQHPSFHLQNPDACKAIRTGKSKSSKSQMVKCVKINRHQCNLSHCSLGEKSMLSAQKHSELIQADLTAKEARKSRKSLLYGRESYSKLDDFIEQKMLEDLVGRQLTSPEKATQDDCLHCYCARNKKHDIQKLSIAFLDHDKKLKHKILQKLLDLFCDDASDLAVVCLQKPDVFQAVNLHGEKSYQVGDGSFGCVYKIQNLHKAVYARKRILYTSEFEKNEVRHLHELGCCDHELRCQDYFPILYGFSREGGGIYIKKQFIETTWRAVKITDQRKIWVMFKDGLTALQCLDKHGIYHRDIKPKNIGCREDCTETNILDFGSSQNAVHDFKETGMTAAYMSPEAVDGSNHKKSDVWALALAVMFLITRKHPFQDQRHEWVHDDPAKVKQLIKTQPKIIIDQVDNAVGSYTWKGLLKWMLQVDPQKRPSPEEALQHQLFQENPSAPEHTSSEDRTSIQPHEEGRSSQYEQRVDDGPSQRNFPPTNDMSGVYVRAITESF